MNNEFRIMNNEALRLTPVINMHDSTFNILYSMP